MQSRKTGPTRPNGSRHIDVKCRLKASCHAWMTRTSTTNSYVAHSCISRLFNYGLPSASNRLQKQRMKSGISCIHARTPQRKVLELLLESILHPVLPLLNAKLSFVLFLLPSPQNSKSGNKIRLSIIMPKRKEEYPQEITATTWSCQANSSCSSDESSSPSGGVDSSSGSHEERWSEERVHRAIEVWGLNGQEAEQLRSLKDRLSDVDHPKNTPHELVKYIKGPKGYDKAEEVFRNVIQWRRDFGTDTILEDYKPPKILYEYVSTAMLRGVDHEGDPVYVERAGALDALGLVRRYDQEALRKHTVWLRELTASGPWRQDYEHEHGHQPRQLTIVFDLEGLSSRHVKKEVIPIFKDFVAYTADKYYGVSKRMIIIRAPAIFRMVWRIAKHFYDPEVQKKMIFASKDYLSVLEQYMPLSILPPCINPTGHGVTARGFPPNLNGGVIPDDVEDDDNASKTSKTTQWSANRSSYSFDSSCDDIMEEQTKTQPSSVAVSCKPLLKGSLTGDYATTKTVEGL